MGPSSFGPTRDVRKRDRNRPRQPGNGGNNLGAVEQSAGATAGSAVEVGCSSPAAANANCQPGTWAWPRTQVQRDREQQHAWKMENGSQQNLDSSDTRHPTHPSSPKRLVCFEDRPGSQPTSLCVITTNSGSARCCIDSPRPRPSPCAIIHVPLFQDAALQLWLHRMLRRNVAFDGAAAPGPFPLLNRTRRPC